MASSLGELQGDHWKGRGAKSRPNNRFETIHLSEDLSDLDGYDEDIAAVRQVKTVYLDDDSQSVVSQNNSPDIPFRYSVNPYRGCSHGCSYCYARPTHEYLGFDAGLDFESRILVKRDAPKLFRDFLAKPGYSPELVMFSGVTDCYQPAERKFKLTRGCLEVAAEANQPIAIITKNALVTRDLDILQEMATKNLVSVALSITTLDQHLSQAMEPQTSVPKARFRAVKELADAGVPVRVMVAPVVPGLTDAEMPMILKAAREAGAVSAGYILLRLPQTVEPVFVDWLEKTQALSASKVQSLIRATREGQMSSSQFGERMRGTGAIAGQIEQTFRVFSKKLGFRNETEQLNTADFMPPIDSTGQQMLF